MFKITFQSMFNHLKLNHYFKIKNLKFKITLTKQGFLKFTKKALASYLALSIIILSSGLIYLFNPWTTRSTEAAWFNDNWGYVIKPI